MSKPLRNSNNNQTQLALLCIRTINSAFNTTIHQSEQSHERAAATSLLTSGNEIRATPSPAFKLLAGPNCDRHDRALTRCILPLAPAPGSFYKTCVAENHLEVGEARGHCNLQLHHNYCIQSCNGAPLWDNHKTCTRLEYS